MRYERALEQIPGVCDDEGERKAGIARALYITATEQRVVILRAFVKTEKTPTGEIELALQRAKELKS